MVDYLVRMCERTDYEAITNTFESPGSDAPLHFHDVYTIQPWKWHGQFGQM
jgi:hypothetical protein